MARKLTLEQKKKAVQIAIDGGNPVDYLKECGSDAPDKTWWFIKNKLKDANPELYAQIPDRRAKRTITAPASTLETKPAVEKEQNKAETINKAMEQTEPMATKPGVKISITEVTSGQFVFIKNTNGIIIENRNRSQTLTLEQEDIRGLVEALPIIVGMFKA